MGTKSLEGVNERQDKDIWISSYHEQKAPMPKNKVLFEKN